MTRRRAVSVIVGPPLMFCSLLGGRRLTLLPQILPHGDADGAALTRALKVVRDEVVILHTPATMITHQ